MTGGTDSSFTSDALLDVHTRAHRSLTRFLEHCAPFDQPLIDREIPGFGFPTIRLQCHHAIGAEEYWVGVIRGDFRVEDDEDRYTTIESLGRYRVEVAAATAAWLRGVTPAELNNAREMLTWQGVRRTLVPARIIMRTQTHLFHHMGQIAAMCRLLERPLPPGNDFPLD